MYFCHLCLQGFGRKDLLDKHLEICLKNDGVRTILPEKGKKILKFKNIQNCVECPIKIFADFESILAPMEETSGKVRMYQKHIPISFVIRIVSRIEGFELDPTVYTGSNAEKVFVKELEKIMRRIYDRFHHPVPMTWSKEAEAKYNAQNKCYACGTEFVPGDRDFESKKVRDHCPFTGKYRGALHSRCNLKLRQPKTFPVFFHNLSG